MTETEIKEMYTAQVAALEARRPATEKVVAAQLADIKSIMETRIKESMIDPAIVPARSAEQVARETPVGRLRKLLKNAGLPTDGKEIVLAQRALDAGLIK